MGFVILHVAGGLLASYIGIRPSFVTILARIQINEALINRGCQPLQHDNGENVPCAVLHYEASRSIVHPYLLHRHYRKEREVYTIGRF